MVGKASLSGTRQKSYSKINWDLGVRVKKVIYEVVLDDTNSHNMLWAQAVFEESQSHMLPLIRKIDKMRLVNFQYPTILLERLRSQAIL